MRPEFQHARLGVVRRMTAAILAIGFVAVWLSSAAGQEMRTWSDKSGKFKIKAKLVESSGKNVVLEKDDGTQVTIPLDKLSEADQKAVAEMGSAEENPFQTVKPAKKPAKKSRVVDEDEEEPAPKKKSAAKKKSTVIDGDEEEPVKKSTRKKKAAADEEESEEEGGEVSGEAKVIKPRWGGVKELLPAPSGTKWSLSIEAPEEPATAKRGRPVAIPAKADFFEGLKGLVINPVCRRAVLGYLWERRGGPAGPPSRRGRGSRGGGDAEGSQTRIVLCDLQTGRVLGTATTPGQMIPMALSDSGEQLLMRNYVFGFGKNDTLEIWGLGKSGIIRELQWIAHDNANGPARDIYWARYIDEERLVTASGGGMLTVWRAANAKPLYYVKINGQGYPALSPDRKYLAAAMDKQIGILDLSAGEVAVALPTPRDPLFQPTLALTPKGMRLVCFAADRVYAWDMGTGALYRDILLAGTKDAHFGREICCPSEDHVLVGGSHSSVLVDLESQAKVWTYKGHEAVEPLGSVCWFVVSPHDRGGALVPSVLPHAAAQEQIQKAVQNPDFFVVKPGCTVRLNVAALADPAEREKAQAALTKKLEANGCQVGPNGAVELVANVETGQKRQLSYRGMGGPFGPGDATYNFQEYASRVKFVLQGQTLWEVVGGNNPGFMISLKQGETVEQYLRAREKPNYDFFTAVELPKLVQKPIAGAGTLGTSEVSVAGVR